MLKVVFLLATVSCKSPEEVLREKGRPEPITCTRTAKMQYTCIDAKRVVWTCGTSDGDATCIATGVLPAEIP